MCDLICRAPHGYHRCFTDEDFEGFVGCDVPNITDDYDYESKQLTTYFPCENCDLRFEEYDELAKHFKDNHKRSKLIKCAIAHYDFAAKSVDTLKMYIGVNHFELVKRNYNWLKLS